MGHASDRMPEDDGEIFALKPEEPDRPPTRVPRMVPREQAVEPQPAVPVEPETARTPVPVIPQVAPPSRAIAYQRGKVNPPAEDELFPDKVVDFQMPIWLIAGGTFIEVVAAFIRAGGTPRLRMALMAVSLQLLAGTFVMLIGILIAARIRHIDLGRLPVAVLKLAAVAIAPGAAVTFMSPFLGLIPFVGGLAGLVLQFVLYFALLGALFKMDESDTWYCVCVIFVVSIGVYFGILAITR